MNPTVAAVEFVGDRLEVTLRDGRRISAPLSWFPTLAAATPEARRDLSIAGLLRTDRGTA